MYVRATPRETHSAPHNRSILMTSFLKSSGPGMSDSRDQKRPPRESGVALAATRFNFRNTNLFLCDGNVAGGQEKGRKSGTKKTCRPKNARPVIAG